MIFLLVIVVVVLHERLPVDVATVARTRAQSRGEAISVTLPSRLAAAVDEEKPRRSGAGTWPSESRRARPGLYSPLRFAAHSAKS